jgi:hypothetical protein
VKSQSKILLCSPYCDFQDSLGIELLDLYASRLTRGQGMFTQTGYHPYTALHLLARNIDAPATVLEYPTEKTFLKEVRRGYEWVGITLSAIDAATVLRMCKQIREYSPHSQIVVGGCGAPALKEELAAHYGQQSERPLVDFLCEGEGVEYLRSLLGQQAIQKIRQYSTFSDVGWSWIPYTYQTASIVAGLGCPNQCFFCSTSHFYKGKHIELADAETIFGCMKKAWRKHPRLRMAVIYDEDFFRDKAKVMKLGELIRSDKEFGLRKLNYMTFGSLSSLEQYSQEELALSGATVAWVGAESVFATLRKLGQHQTQQMFDSLHEHGISTVGSWIVGLDVHESGNIEIDLEAFIQLKPTLAQISILTPMAGTPLWRSLREDGRLMPDFDWSRAHAYALNFHHPDMDESTCLEVIERGYKELNSRYGPTLLRDFWVHLNGLKFCLSSQNRFLREDKAECHRKALSEAFTVLKSIKMLAANPSVQESASRAIEEYQQLVGRINWRLKLIESSLYFRARIAQRHSSVPRVSKPSTRKYQYDGERAKIKYPGKPMLKFWKAVYRMFQNLLYAFLQSGTKINGMGIGTAEDKDSIGRDSG